MNLITKTTRALLIKSYAGCFRILLACIGAGILLAMGIAWIPTYQNLSLAAITSVVSGRSQAAAGTAAPPKDFGWPNGKVVWAACDSVNGSVEIRAFVWRLVGESGSYLTDQNGMMDVRLARDISVQTMFTHSSGSDRDSEGVVDELWSLLLDSAHRGAAPSGQSFAIETGWPLACFEGSLVISSPTVQMTGAGLFTTRPSSRTHSGIYMIRLQGRESCIPYRPIPYAFAANSLAFGFATFALWVLWRASAGIWRRIPRRRDGYRSRCTDCGHLLHESQRPCPECGSSQLP